MAIACLQTAPATGRDLRKGIVVRFASKKEDEEERWVENNKESAGSLDSTKRISRAVLNWQAPVVPSRRRSILELLSEWLVLIAREESKRVDSLLGRTARSNRKSLKNSWL